MRLKASQREECLLEAGYTRAELVRMKKPLTIIRKQRARTQETMGKEFLHEKIEKISRGVKKLFISPQERQHRQYLKQWRCASAKGRAQQSCEVAHKQILRSKLRDTERTVTDSTSLLVDRETSPDLSAFAVTAQQ